MSTATAEAETAQAPFLFRCDVRYELENEVWIAVTAEDVAKWREENPRKVGQLTDEYVAACIAEECAEEASEVRDATEEECSASAFLEKWPDKPNDLVKKVTVFSGDGEGRELYGEDLQDMLVAVERLDRYGRPLPPPPLKGQLDLAGREVE